MICLTCYNSLLFTCHKCEQKIFRQQIHRIMHEEVVVTTSEHLSLYKSYVFEQEIIECYINHQDNPRKILPITLISDEANYPSVNRNFVIGNVYGHNANTVVSQAVLSTIDGDFYYKSRGNYVCRVLGSAICEITGTLRIYVHGNLTCTGGRKLYGRVNGDVIVGKYHYIDISVGGNMKVNNVTRLTGVIEGNLCGRITALDAYIGGDADVTVDNMFSSIGGHAKIIALENIKIGCHSGQLVVHRNANVFSRGNVSIACHGDAAFFICGDLTGTISGHACGIVFGRCDVVVKKINNLIVLGYDDMRFAQKMLLI